MSKDNEIKQNTEQDVTEFKPERDEELEALLSTIDNLIGATGGEPDRPQSVTAGDEKGPPGAADERIVSGKVFTEQELIDMDFYEPQVHEVLLGQEHGVDASIYAKECYNWMQMYEIRMGLEKKLDISLYSNPLFQATQMREIRLGLENGLDVSSYARLILSVGDMKRMRRDLIAEMYRKNPSCLGRELYDEEEDLYIRISENCMEAYLKIPSNSQKKHTILEIISILKRHEIEYGISEPSIRDVVYENITDREVLVAQGDNADAGEDGYYEFFFDEDTFAAPTAAEDGHIDYDATKESELAKAGQVLAIYHPAKVGKSGVTVTGIPVTGGNGVNLPKLTCVGVSFDTKTYTYTADEKGSILYDPNNYTLSIRQMYVIEGDANRYNGNIEFNGSVHVRGSVNDMTHITATGDIIVDGFVGGATLTAGRNVLIKGGANAGGHGRILAGGRVMGKFFEAIDIKAVGTVEANYFMNCIIETDDRVIARGNKSRITGGTIMAAIAVDTAYMLPSGNARMRISVGDTQWLSGRIALHKSKRDTAADELTRLMEGKEKLQVALGLEALEGNAIYEKTCAAIVIKENELAEADRELRRLRHVKELSNNAYVSVGKELEEGVTIFVQDNLRDYHETIRGSVLMRANG
jgi:uncharacterized protein (DUF342 family)